MATQKIWLRKPEAHEGILTHVPLNFLGQQSIYVFGGWLDLKYPLLWELISAKFRVETDATVGNRTVGLYQMAETIAGDKRSQSGTYITFNRITSGNIAASTEYFMEVGPIGALVGGDLSIEYTNLVPLYPGGWLFQGNDYTVFRTAGTTGAADVVDGVLTFKYKGNSFDDIRRNPEVVDHGD